MTSLAVAVGLWGGVKTESFVNPPKELEPEVIVTPQYPAAEDSQRLGNEFARNRLAESNQHARQLVSDALAREEADRKYREREKARAAAKLVEREKQRAAAREVLAREAAAREAAQAAQVAANKKAAAEKAAAPKVKEKVEVVSRSDAPKSSAIAFEATAYIAMCDTGCTGITATGIDVRSTIYAQGHRVIAVDPAVIALGSIVRVNTGYGSFTAIAADTGGHIKGHRIDILMSSLSEAQSFGRSNVSIQIIRNGAK